ncbi:hypothetical protein FisN_25Hh023 [Fistulifera solaris]|uniref:Pseudouridine synthase RsuA/RluA-like domain-containing protein n=1 Tax=Fistulifera solaris TaxID=1519565 RepID=A0A1Z5JVU5_FISSO|nr:hypothetical protein FisN_25Hh023 [Fistulifera solaris]|eukprot:GAX18049.1 hypothetical protein FisN_25Hh023 [Fistulifera solaris]
MATSYFSIGFLLPLMMILAYSHAFIPLLNPSLLPRNSELLRRYQSQEISDQSSSSPSEQVRQKLQTQMEILRKQDETSTTIQPSDLEIVYQDDHLVVVNKPYGVLCTSKEYPSLAQAIFEACKPSGITIDQMIVHRLGRETSGLMVCALTMEGVRGLQTLFRTRKITRQYEALVVGHLNESEGLIRLPLMRDIDHPPFMRVSTEEQQRRLLDLNPDIVPRKLMEAPKAAMTHFVVKTRDYLQPEQQVAPVTRLQLTSISGRTHQLNVHCAARGHPIVGDFVYGYQGTAAPNGGLDSSELPAGAATEDVQVQVQKQQPQRMCVHASLIRFKHPITKETVECISKPPF